LQLVLQRLDEQFELLSNDVGQYRQDVDGETITGAIINKTHKRTVKAKRELLDNGDDEDDGASSSEESSSDSDSSDGS
jgi:hypothetical protein